MDFESVLSEIYKLPLADRVAFVQRVLDSITGEMEGGETEFSPGFRAELDRRIAEDEAHPERGIPWEAVEAGAIAREDE
jgi:putative addiction module component (TIGR02574 family)